MQRLEGKIIAIAGGAGGIGGEISRRLASEGASVVVGDIDIGEAELVAREIRAAGGRARPQSLQKANGAVNGRHRRGLSPGF